jgi:hypothetical protein
MPRLIECLCDSHAVSAQDRWPVTGDLSALIEECWACGSRSRSCADTLGTLSVRSVPDLVGYDFEHMTATHEAGHAVLAVIAGHPVKYVSIDPYTADISTSPGGRVNLGPYSVPVLDHLAMLWAGQEAALRWLGHRAMDTAANRVDVRFMGWTDLADGAEFRTQYGLADDAGLDECRYLLDEHWPRVEATAKNLAEARYLTGDEVAQIADLTGCHTH